MTTTDFWADTETGSECDLKKHGLYRYAEHPSSHIQLISYAIDDGDAVVWDKLGGERMPSDLKDGFRDPNVRFIFHNVQFDRTMLKATMGIDLPLSRLMCVMAQALSHGLPGALEKCGDILGIRDDAKKIKDGKRLMMMFCKPIKNRKTGELTWNTPYTHPEEWVDYKAYCGNDTLAMREISRKMPKWNYPNESEHRIWRLDQLVNAAGLPIDMDLVHAAIGEIGIEQAYLSNRTKEMTYDEELAYSRVQSATQRDAMLRYLNDVYEMNLANLQKSTIDRILDDSDLAPDLRELLEVRRAATTSSTAKYKKIVDSVSADGCLRGTIQYCGASRTGRDGGKILNPLNLPKPTVKHEEVLLGIDALIGGYAVPAGFHIMPLTSSAIRYAIKAPKGYKIVAGDLKAIEARVTPYNAKENWKVDFFRDYDAGLVKYDNYQMAYAKSFNIDPSKVTKDNRQIGKIQELALGFGGGAGSLVSFANMYKIDIADMADKIRASTPANIMAEAESFYDWMCKQEIKGAKELAKDAGKESDWESFHTRNRTYGLDKDVYAPLEAAKRLWRAGHPATAATWKEADNAMRSAIEVPKTKFWFGNCYFIRHGKWVRMMLPSGRSLCYPGAKINKKGDIVFQGTHQLTKQWCEIRTTGAKLFQNCWAADTKVLTDRGIVPIVEVTAADKVWDGEVWVSTGGVRYQGTRTVGTWLGTRVTEDHRINTCIWDGYDSEKAYRLRGTIKLASRKRRHVWREVGKITPEERALALKKGWSNLPYGAKNTINHCVDVRFRVSMAEDTFFSKLPDTADLPSWTALPDKEPVYDLINCGPLKQFTIVTDAGPVIVHNCVQALARDFFKHGQILAYKAGYKTILVVYDELVTLVPDSDEFSPEGLVHYMTQNPPWALDFPLGADAFEDYRYHKSLD